MKAFDKIVAAVVVFFIIAVAAANWILLHPTNDNGRPYLVEVNRLGLKIEAGTYQRTDLENCDYVTAVSTYGEDFFEPHSDYVIRKIDGTLYRFDYTHNSSTDNSGLIVTVNCILALLAVVMLGVLCYIKWTILHPFDKLKDTPYALSKGNLTTPLKETKNRFFGKFIWGLDLLRENMEQQKERELELQRDRKVLLLSLSHDIKTPLSAIKLYAKALSKGLYTDKAKQQEVTESIHAKADEIEGYVNQIISASREDFLSLDVNLGEFYLSTLMTKLRVYYQEKLALVKTDFTVGDYSDVLLSGDLERSEEVIQNMMENAIKYGDGKRISLDVSEEDGCILVTVCNSGCTMSDTELPHMFESFWRGTNAHKEKGSGLGLYICRQLMRKMNGEVFAQIRQDDMCVTAVFSKA